MSKIIETKFINKDKIEIKLELDYEQFQALKGCMENVHIFSEDNLDYHSRLVQRGKKESTMYFLLPKEKRKEVFPTANVDSTIIENDFEFIYIFKVLKS